MNLQKTLAFLEEVEGISLVPYLDSKKIPTQGIGTVYKPDGAKVTMQDPPITRKVAEAWAKDRIISDGIKICVLCKPLTLSDNQLIALTSFCYNEGLRAFENSTLLKVIRDEWNNFSLEQWDKDVSTEFMKWTKITVNGAKVEDKGLKNRRAKELALFFS